jgi:hypothetical protein
MSGPTVVPDDRVIDLSNGRTRLHLRVVFQRGTKDPVLHMRRVGVGTGRQKGHGQSDTQPNENPRPPSVFVGFPLPHHARMRCHLPESLHHNVSVPVEPVSFLHQSHGLVEVTQSLQLTGCEDAQMHFR